MRRRWATGITLGRLAAPVLAGWLALDVGLRFVPGRWFGANPFADAVRRPAPVGSFAPNFRAYTNAYVGDAALEANRRPTERHPPLQVSFDERGFRRNPRLAPGVRPDLLLLGGASFGYGAGLSDDATFAAALDRAAGRGVYNGALFHEDERSMDRVDRLLGELPGRPRTALLVVLEHETPLPAPGVGRATRLARAYPQLAPAVWRLKAARREVEAARRWAERWWALSPLDVVATRLFRRLGDDRLLPNEHARTTRTLALPDGRPMIFRGYELHPARAGRSAADAPAMAAGIARWKQQLAARGVETRVLLLPSRYSVYGALLEEPAERAAPSRVAAYIDGVAAELRGQGIPAVNALALFREVAPAELRSGTLSFYREDNHWNPRGVERVARAVADSLAVWDAARPGGDDGLASRDALQ